jgi:hypothetical protein
MLSKGNNHLGIKKGLKIAILTLFLASFFISTTKAQQISYFYDDFESYNFVDLPMTDDCNSTTYNYCRSSTYYSIPQVVTSYSHSPTKSILPPWNSTYGSNLVTTPAVFTTSTEGQVSVWVRHHKTNNLDFKFYAGSQITSAGLDCGIKADINNYYYLTEDTGHNPKWIAFASSTNDTWDYLIIAFKQINDLMYCKYYYNFFAVSDYIIAFNSHLANTIQRVFFYFNNSTANGQTWIDDFETGSEITAEPTGYYLVWNLEKPTPCQFPEPSKYNQVSTTTNFEVKGSLGIPNNNPYIWYHLRLKFWNWNTNKILYFDYDLPNLKKNQTYNFDYFLDISSILSNSTDLISFSMNAYGKDGYGNVYYDLYPSVCEIYLGLTSEQPVFTPPEEQFPLQPELEDCSQYNIPDRWICEIKNALKSIFLPSSEKINELKQTTDLFKQKFPFNYIDLFKSFYQDINNGINENSTISFKILGQSSNVNLAFWENQATIGGIKQTFSHIIYNIFLFLFLFIFVLWLISYLKRIF